MKKTPGCSGYMGDYTTQLCGDYFINHYYKDPSLNNDIFMKKISKAVVFLFSTAILKGSPRNDFAYGIHLLGAGVLLGGGGVGEDDPRVILPTWRMGSQDL